MEVARAKFHGYELFSCSGVAPPPSHLAPLVTYPKTELWVLQKHEDGWGIGLPAWESPSSRADPIVTAD